MINIFIVITFLLVFNLNGGSVFDGVNYTSTINCNKKIKNYLNKKVEYGPIVFATGNKKYVINNKDYYEFAFNFIDSKDSIEYNGYVREEKNKVYFLSKGYYLFSDSSFFGQPLHKENLLFDFDFADSIDSWEAHGAGIMDYYKVSEDTTYYNEKEKENLYVYNLSLIEKEISHMDILKKIYVSKKRGIIQFSVNPEFNEGLLICCMQKEK